jgi:hypothetical protein
LPQENTIFVLESPPLHVLEKEGKRFFPYVFFKDGFQLALLSMGNPTNPKWEVFEKTSPIFLDELRKMSRGFSLSTFSFPQKKGKYQNIGPQGLLLLGQTSDRKEIEGQWERLRSLFFSKGKRFSFEERALGGSPLTGKFLTEVFQPKRRGMLGSLAYSRRGKIVGLHANSFYGWNKETAKTRGEMALEAAELQLGAGLGTLGLKRGGTKVEGLDVFQPQGIILGRLVSNSGPFFRRLEESWKKRNRGVTPPQMLGFLSIEGAQDTIWKKDGKFFERMEIVERQGVPSIVDAFTILPPKKGKLKGLLPAKAVGFLRISVNLPWVKNLFQQIQASQHYSVSTAEMVRSLNTIRAILGMPIPKKNPKDMKDMVGNQEILILLALPSPGTFWPEVFILSPKLKTSLSREDRLSALADPLIYFLLRGKPFPDKRLLLSSIKFFGEGTSRVAYLNYFTLVQKTGTRRSYGILRGFLPGGGKFSVGSNEDFEILSFSPATLRRYLRGKRTSDSSASWGPSSFSGEQGKLLQAGINLAPLIQVYPFQTIFTLIRTITISLSKGKKRKLPNFQNLGALFGAETFRIQRLPSQGGKKGVIVLHHEGGSFLSPYSILAMAFGGTYLDHLMRSQ